MIRIFLLSMLILLNSGCAFIGGGAIGEAVYTSPSQGEPHNIHYMLKTDFTKHETGAGTDKYIKLSDIEAEWGKPSEVVFNNDIKSVTYKKGLRWKGVIAILVVVPIPIAVPVGHKTVTFHLKDDTLINWTIHDSHYCVSYTGFNLIPYAPLGFISESSSQWHKDMSPTDGKMACDVLFYDKCYNANENGGMGGESLRKSK